MAKIHSALSEEPGRTDAQAAIVDLIDLTLLGKQALERSAATAFHPPAADELVKRHAHMTLSRARHRARGEPDGRVSRIAQDTRLPQLDPGYIQDDKVVAFVAPAAQSTTSGSTSKPQRKPTRPRDLLIAAAQDLEQQH